MLDNWQEMIIIGGDTTSSIDCAILFSRDFSLRRNMILLSKTYDYSLCSVFYSSLHIYCSFNHLRSISRKNCNFQTFRFMSPVLGSDFASCLLLFVYLEISKWTKKIHLTPEIRPHTTRVIGDRKCFTSLS